MKERADAVVGMSLLAACVLVVGGFMSLISFIGYLYDGEIRVNPGAAVCIVMAAIFLVVFLTITIPVARVLLSSEEPGARRASYFAVLFPIFLVSFLMATPQASFAPTFTFGWPLLLLGSIAYPFSAFAMKRGIKRAEMRHLLLLECFRCSYVFEMHKEQPMVRCPYCGQVNMNPTMGEGKPAPPHDTGTEERVSP